LFVQTPLAFLFILTPVAGALEPVFGDLLEEIRKALLLRPRGFLQIAL